MKVVESAPQPGRWPGALRRHSVGLIAVAVGALTFFLYALTLAPGLTWSNSASDGGDLLTATFTWGIPHPTGYPTYLLSLRGFSAVIPTGSEALHGNLFSALTASIAVGLLFMATVRILRTLSFSGRITDRHILIAAGVSSLSMAASKELWSQATVTEVYALNAMFVSVILLAAHGLRDRQQQGGVGWRYGLIIGLLSGIALGNHLTIASVIIPLFAWGLLGGGLRFIRVRHVCPIALGGVLGLSVYLYAPLASSQGPVLNWGHPDSAQGFWWMVNGTVYQGYAFGVQGSELYDRLVTVIDLLFSQFAFLGVLLGLVGFTLLWTLRRQLVVTHVVTVALLVVYTVTYRTVDSFIYLIPVFMLVSIWMAAGILRLMSSIDQIPRATSIVGSIDRRVLAGLVIVAVVAAVPGFSIATNFDQLDLSNDREASEYVVAAFETIEPGSVVFTRTDQTVFGLWYQAYVAEPEQDVMPVSVPHIVFDWYWDDLAEQFPDRMPADRPDGLQPRVIAIIDHNLGINTLYDAHDSGAGFPELTFVEDRALYRIEPG
jgi:hypothetical protein